MAAVGAPLPLARLPTPSQPPPAALLSAEGYNVTDPVLILSFGDVGQTVRACHALCVKRAPCMPTLEAVCIAVALLRRCRLAGFGRPPCASGCAPTSQWRVPLSGWADGVGFVQNKAKPDRTKLCRAVRRWPTCWRAPPWAAPCPTSCST